MEISNLRIPLEEIAEKYGGFVAALCRRLILDDETAKDAAQHAWGEIVKSYPSYKGESKVTTWMHTIVRRAVMEYAMRERTYSTRHLRDYFREDREPVPSYKQGMDKDLWIRQMCDRCLTGILHCLDADTRLAYILKDIGGLTYAELAIVFGKNEAALRKSVTRSRHKIKEFLNNECYLYNPEGDCKCRMKKYVREVNLRVEYSKLKKTASLAEFLRKSGQMLPEMNYWKNIAV